MKLLVKKINRTIYYGWIIVAVAAVSMFFSSPGQTYSISVFNKIYETELGYTKTMLSTGYSIATIVSGMLIVFVGRAIDKLGHRKMFIFVTIMLSAATLFSSFVSSIWMIYISFFFLRFFGQGSFTILPNNLVPQWFEKRRAFAISIMSLGAFVGTLFVPRLNLFLIESFGWENAWRIWGLALIIVFLPLVLLFVYERPEDLGMTIENEKSDLTKDEAIALLVKESFTLREAIHTKEFWFISLMSMIVPMFTTGVTFHFFSIMDLRNVGNETASWIIGLVAFPILIMPFIAKIFIDKVKPNYIFLMTQTMILLSMALLWLWVSSSVTAIIFILFYGLAAAIQSVTLNTVWPHYFGRKYLGSIRGMATVFMVLGSALGPLPFGVSYDQFNTFNPAIWIMMGMTLIAMFLSILIQKPVRKIENIVYDSEI